jgi:hypothetical protein
MKFIDVRLESMLSFLNQLDKNTQPKWGEMNAQRMVEHLTDALQMAMGKVPVTLMIPEDKVEKLVAFLDTDKPMARNIEVPFAKKETPLRNEEIELAIDEFVDSWLAFEEKFTNDLSLKTIHPFYGSLNHDQWMKLHTKHFTHHMQQFGLYPENS